MFGILHAELQQGSYWTDLAKIWQRNKFVPLASFYPEKTIVSTGLVNRISCRRSALIISKITIKYIIYCLAPKCKSTDNIISTTSGKR